MIATFDDTGTAIGTLALAAATFVSLFFARSALRKTQDQLELGQQQLAQTQREIELSRTQVEQAHRPVLVPVVLQPLRSNRTRRLPGESEFIGPGRPGVTEPGVLSVQVMNVGSGAALRIAASVERLDKDGDRYTSAGELQPPSEMTAIGKDDSVSIDIHYRGWEEHWDFELTLVYEDIAGKSWVTVARYISEYRRYENVSVKVGDDQRLTVDKASGARPSLSPLPNSI